MLYLFVFTQLRMQNRCPLLLELLIVYLRFRRPSRPPFFAFLIATRPVTIYSGVDDELMLSGKYAEAVHPTAPSVDVKLIEGVNHMGIVSAPKAVSVIAEDVATRGQAGSYGS